MTGTFFRQDIASKVLVPGDGRSALGTETAQVLAVVLDLLRRGESLIVTQAGVEAAGRVDGNQWLMVQSAGSTGAPKTIRRKPASWIASFDVTRGRFSIGPDAPYAVLGAMSHSLTLYAVLEALHIGSDLSVLTGLAPRVQARRLRETEAQVLYVTPTQLRLLTGVSAPKNPSLRWVFCGGGTLDPQTRAQVSHVFPSATLHEFFGASETSFMTLSDTDTPLGSVGRAYPGVELRVRGAQGQDTSGFGEIWVKSPYLFDGYDQGNSPETRWDGSYLTIGEMGQLDDVGNLTVLGRKNRMVTVSDHNVFPEAIEAQMRAVPGVGNCVAVPIPDVQRGNVIVGVLEGAQDAALADHVQAQCRAVLGPHAAPRRIVFVERMPMLSAGKPDLITLADQLGQLA
ncbi:AMP-binding protein [Aliiroseovarius sp. Z3]|uniref:AMP-binding protein n=1 Tax=Aliiroseovarius sp. Z3 TaxID=2811402 RepID=UPI0023B34947|nr:AMP-binding protein [Aliiroseovarius sp. Z3]MDE9449835.1 AMP-binding protein [Aliiroseovarius sp. Z3]